MMCENIAKYFLEKVLLRFSSGVSLQNRFCSYSLDRSILDSYGNEEIICE